MGRIFKKKRLEQGLTMIELMLGLAVTGIVLALAVPSFSKITEKKNLEGAAEKLFADLQFAKSESIRRNQNIYITFDNAKQCYGLSVGAACTMTSADCTTTTTCNIDSIPKVVKMSDFGNTTFSQALTSNMTFFESRRGMANNTGTVSLTSPSGKTTSVEIGLIRIKLVKDEYVY